MNPKTEQAQQVLNKLKDIVATADLEIIKSIIPYLKNDIKQTEQDHIGHLVHTYVRQAVMDAVLVTINTPLEDE